MLLRFNGWAMAALASIAISARAARAQGVSPLQTVMDGRDEAGNTMMNEAGITTLAQQAANATMFICGALAIIFTALALKDLYFAQEDAGMMSHGGDRQRAGMMKLVIAGLVSIPAIIAAVLPYTLLGQD